MTCIIALLLACGGSGGGGSHDAAPRPGDTASDTGENGGDDTGDAPFRPEEGHWTFGDHTVVYDTCRVDPSDLPAGGGDGFTLAREGGGHFTMLLDGADDPIACTLSGMDYACDRWTAHQPVEGMDIAIVSTVDVAGAFSDATHATARYDIGIDCTGSDCALAEAYTGIDFPCAVSADVSASADGA